MSKEFENFEEAFSCCREKNYPLSVKIDGKIYKIFPSGRVEEKRVPIAIETERS